MNCVKFPVDAGTRAVIFDKIQGVQQKVVGEGTHFRIPYIQVKKLRKTNFLNENIFVIYFNHTI